jgi:hypothetical protein
MEKDTNQNAYWPMRFFLSNEHIFLGNFNSKKNIADEDRR